MVLVVQRYRLEEYKEGKDLLDRCDKLLNSIAEITAANELQPSPVSVLDSSFDKDDWCSPSPITKRCIDYKGKWLACVAIGYRMKLDFVVTYYLCVHIQSWSMS